MQTTNIDNSIYLLSLLTSNPNVLLTDTAIVAVSSLFADPLNKVSSMRGTSPSVYFCPLLWDWNNKMTLSKKYPIFTVRSI